MRFNPRARINPGQVEDRGAGGNGSGGGPGGGFGGSGMRLPLPTGGGGRIGVGTVVILVLAFVLTQCLGGGPEGGDQPGSGSPAVQAGSCQSGADANAHPYDCGIDLITTSVQNYWANAYEQQTGQPYQDILTVKFSGRTSSGCGAASSEMGPFYCPNDQRVYLDTTFMEQVLQGRLGAKGGPFALAYVLAHEYGHHIEDQLGILGQVRTQHGATSDSVKVELMADCLAGAWAKDASTTKDENGATIIERLTQDDIDRAIDAAQSVGDDYIQKRGSGGVDPESWTHGSSEQRAHWFNVGREVGTIDACNTFKAGAL